jgi:hypothetical protein
MRREAIWSALGLVIACCIGLALEPRIGQARAPLRGLQAAPPVALSGQVLSGRYSDAAFPLGFVGVELYCSENAESMGQRVAATVTNSNGGYELLVPAACEYCNVVVGEAAGYQSFLADALGGRVVRPNWIQHQQPLKVDRLLGDIFWFAPVSRLAPSPTSGPTQSPAPTQVFATALTAPATPSVTPAEPQGSAPPWVLALLLGTVSFVLTVYRRLTGTRRRS